MKHFTRFFRRSTRAEIVATELADAQLALLKARTGHEYACGIIAYREAQCKRLTKFLAELEK